MVFNCFEVGIWKLEVYENCLLEILCNNKRNKCLQILIYTGIYWSIYNKIYTSQFPTTTTIKLSINVSTIWWYNHSITYFKNSFYKQIINVLMIQKNPHDSHTSTHSSDLNVWYLWITPWSYFLQTRCKKSWLLVRKLSASVTLGYHLHHKH